MITETQTQSIHRGNIRQNEAKKARFTERLMEYLAKLVSSLLKVSPFDWFCTNVPPYGLEACPLSTSQIKQLDFAVNCFYETV